MSSRQGEKRGIGWDFDIFQKIAVKFPTPGQKCEVKYNQISHPENDLWSRARTKIQISLPLEQQENSNALPRAKAIDQNLASSRRSVSRLEEANQNPTLCPAPFPRRLDIDRCIKQSIRICWEECCLNRSDSAMITKSVTLEQDGMYMLHITNCQANLCRVVFSSCKLWSMDENLFGNLYSP